jgi:hypothetical protein
MTNPSGRFMRLEFFPPSDGRHCLVFAAVSVLVSQRIFSRPRNAQEATMPSFAHYPRHSLGTFLLRHAGSLAAITGLILVFVALMVAQPGDNRAAPSRVQPRPATTIAPLPSPYELKATEVEPHVEAF